MLLYSQILIRIDKDLAIFFLGFLIKLRQPA